MHPDSRRLHAGLGLTAWSSIALFFATFLVYCRTLAPGVYGFDSAELATGVFTQGIVHPPGYPLYLIIGRLFILLPFGDVAYRLNVMSAVFASLAVVLLFLAIQEIFCNRIAALVASLLFAVSNYFWQMALIAEVYTLFTAFIAANLLVLALWRRMGEHRILLAFSVLFGLTLAVHTSGLLFAPGFACLVVFSPFWKKTSWRLLPAMLLLAVLGLGIPYLYLVLRSTLNPALDYTNIYSDVNLATPQGLWWYVSGRAYTIFAFGYRASEISLEFQRFILYLWRNFLGFGVLVGILGFIALARRDAAWAAGLFLVFLGNSVFYVNYRVMDKDTMFLPAYEVWTVFLAGGLSTILNWAKKSNLLSVLEFNPQKTVYAILSLIVVLGLGLNWRWVDMSRADGYMLFARDMLAESAPNAMVIAPWSSAVVLEYYQLVEGQRPDLQIINRSRYGVARYHELLEQGLSHDQIMAEINAEEVSFIGEILSWKTVYAVEYDPVLARRFEYLPEGMVFRLVEH